MRKSPQLYWVLLTLLLPVFSGTAIYISLQSKTQVTDQIIKSFDDKVSQIISLVDIFIDGDQHLKLSQADETSLQRGDSINSQSYNQGIRLFSELRKKTGLSYLYTLDLLGSKNLYYILDGSDPEEFTPIGTIDTLPEGYNEIINSSSEKGYPVVNPVKEWDNWGLIKTGFGPIHLSDGSTAGFIGADISVDIIRVKEKQGIQALILCAVFGTFISFSVAILATNRFVHPINRLKNGVIKMAGGGEISIFNDFRIYEFNDLAKSFETLKSKITQIEVNNTFIYNQLINKQLKKRFRDFTEESTRLELCSEQLNINIENSYNDLRFNCIRKGENLLIYCCSHQTGEKSNLLSTKVSKLTSEMKMNRFDDWLQLLQATGYAKKVNLFMIGIRDRLVHYHLLEKHNLIMQENASTQSSESQSGSMIINHDEIRIELVDDQNRSCFINAGFRNK